MWNFLHSLHNILPCLTCDQECKEYVLKNPPPVDNAEKLQKWGWKFHNTVNKRLGKDGWTWEQTKKYYANTKLVVDTSGVTNAVGLHNKTLPPSPAAKQVTCRIETTDAALKGQTVSSSYKPAVLNNGLNIQVPPFIEAGDEVVIDTRNLEYIKKN